MNEEQEVTQERKLKRIKAHVAQLMEEFDTVQIIATYRVENGTQRLRHGEGSIYARMELCREFVRDCIRSEENDDESD